MDDQTAREFSSLSTLDVLPAWNSEARAGCRPVGGDLPPVIARIPWLDEDTSLDQQDESPRAEADWLRAQSVVIAPEWDATTWCESTNHLRVDPPQSRYQVADDDTNSSTRAVAVPAEPIPVILPPAPAMPPHPPMHGLERGQADLDAPRYRFDPAEQAGKDESTKRSAVAPQEGTTGHPASWHQYVTAIDDFIQRHQRLIVLAALLTAGGLLMLVLDGGSGPALPPPESISPAASAPPAPLALEPMPMVESPPEVEVETPAAAVPEMTAPEAEAVATARGPGGRPRAIKESAEAPLDALHEEFQPLEPHREPHVAEVEVAATEEPPTVAALAPAAERVDSPVATAPADEPMPAAPLYVDTGAPEIKFPLKPADVKPQPRMARLSGELQPVSK